MTLRRFLSLAILVVLNFSCDYNTAFDPNDCEGVVQLSLVETVEADCGVNNGSIEVAATGGDGVFTFLLNGTNEQEAPIFSALGAGTYTVSVVDGNGCSAALEVTVTDNGDVSLSAETSAAGCNSSNGSISLSASGSVGDFEFSLNNSSFSEQNTFTGLPAGDYSVAVRDGDGCGTSTSVRVSTGVSFSEDIVSIINANCAVSGCHAGTQPPDFRVRCNILSRAQRIRTRTSNRSMPPGSRSISDSAIQTIACWVEDGAPNN